LYQTVVVRGQAAFRQRPGFRRQGSNGKTIESENQVGFVSEKDFVV
jgi:hypothetical protein